MLKGENCCVAQTDEMAVFWYAFGVVEMKESRPVCQMLPAGSIAVVLVLMAVYSGAARSSTGKMRAEFMRLSNRR